MWARSNFACYATEFSPYREDLLAVASAQYYGIVGNGKQTIFKLNCQAQRWEPLIEWITQDGVYDCTWSEDNENVIATGQGDGTVKLFDINRPHGPILNFPAGPSGHQAEVYGVDWNLNQQNLLCSASWDKSTIVWDVMKHAPLRRYRCHEKVAYAAIWSPYKGSMFASVAGDGRLHVMDINTPNERPCTSIQAHQYEVLSLDWCKYHEYQCVTGGVDKTIRCWDIRKPNIPLSTMFGHQLAIRRIKCHPHQGSLVASVSYDMSVKIWDLKIAQMVQSFDHHQEFVLGVDLSLFTPGLIASASWDRTICVWNHEQGAPPPPPPGFCQPAPSSGGATAAIVKNAGLQGQFQQKQAPGSVVPEVAPQGTVLGNKGAGKKGILPKPQG